ncbi:GNAT family N-acetyltransferase [Glutamicibacter soli]|uniref:GNAT family N-acetyltransferase n=1 Tax=Glutamicibacter soli TaxID=453836 RepID=UPI003C74C721
MTNPAGRLLDIYDSQLRTDAEMQGAIRVGRLGPLYLAVFPGGQGFITSPRFTGGEPAPLSALVGPALEYFTARSGITEVEFKTRGHDHAPGLHEALLSCGFSAGQPESVMLGRLEHLISGLPAPQGVQVRRISTPLEVEQMCAMSAEAFGQPPSPGLARELAARMDLANGLELWVAWAGARMVGAGRLEPVAGTEVVGLWGGGVLPAYRGRGIYRALTDARARSARAAGHIFAHSDSTEYSRPILERQGMVKVTTTTPYTWKRSG